MNNLFVIYENRKKLLRHSQSFDTFKKDLQQSFSLSESDFKNHELVYQNDKNEEVQVKTNQEYEKALNYFQISGKIFNFRKAEKIFNISVKPENNTSIDLLKSDVFELSFPHEVTKGQTEDVDCLVPTETVIKSLQDLKFDYARGAFKTIDIPSLKIRAEKKKRLSVVKLDGIMIYPTYEAQYKTKQLEELVDDLYCACKNIIQAEYFTCSRCNQVLFCSSCKDFHEHPTKRNLIDLDKKFENMIQKIISLGWTDETLVRMTLRKNNGNYSKSLEFLISGP